MARGPSGWRQASIGARVGAASVHSLGGLSCDAVLEMGIDSTEGETLPLCTAAVLEGVVCTSSIVAVVV